MIPALTQRRVLIAVAFLVGVVSAALAPSEEAPPPVKRGAKLPSLAGAAPQAQRAPARGDVSIPDVANYKRESEEKVDVTDIFEARAAPGAAVAPPPPKPVAPKLPFTFAGVIEESGKAKAVLVQGEQLHMVAKGDKFAGSYQLEELDLEKLVVIYLPLGERQRLNVGETPK